MISVHDPSVADREGMGQDQFVRQVGLVVLAVLAAAQDRLLVVLDHRGRQGVLRRWPAGMGRRSRLCLSYVNSDLLFAGFQRVHGMRLGARPEMVLADVREGGRGGGDDVGVPVA
jgi:hypothetical protein